MAVGLELSASAAFWLPCRGIAPWCVMWRRQAAKIVFTTELTDEGYPRHCVYAVCCNSDDEAGPIWGDGPASILRALATLTQICACGASFHYHDEGADAHKGATNLNT